MKRYFTWILFALLSAMPLMAQPPQNSQNQQSSHRPQFNPEEFRKGLESYIRQRVGLTQAEADKILPIYFEMKGKQMEINQSISKLKRSAMPGPQNQNNNTNYKDVVNQINSLNVELAKVEQTYYNRMCKEVDAKKVLNLMLAEDAFHRDMLRRAAPGGGNRPQGFGGFGGGFGGFGGGHHNNNNWGAPRNGQQQNNK